jgi:DNA-binding NarL/FixJ family response regulator
MPNERSGVVLIRAMHPALEGVVRLAASAVGCIDRIIVVEDDDLAAAVGSTPSRPIVVLDHQHDPTLSDVRSIRALETDPWVVLLIDTGWGGSALGAIRLGVRAFVRVPDALETLPDVIDRVALGERAIPTDLERSAVRELGRSVHQARAASELTPAITARERQVLELLADGCTMRQIGRRLGISSRTVESHVGKLYRKLAVRSRIQAITRGSALGLIELG